MGFSKMVNGKFFEDLLNDILLICPPKRKSKYPPSYFLKALIFILKTGTAYRDALALFKEILHVEHAHYTTVYKKFKVWSESGVFDIIYDKLVSVYSKHKFVNIKFLDVIVDSTHIRNKNGADMIEYGHKDHGKQGNTITTVVDSDRFPLYVRMDPANISDATIIEPVISHLDQAKDLPEKLYVIGDKGYIKKKKIRIGKKKIRLVTPTKKNEKRRNTKKEKKKLKKRPNVEGFFATLKHFRRISNRYEKKSFNYFSYVLFAMIMLGIEEMKKMNKEKSHKKIT